MKMFSQKELENFHNWMLNQNQQSRHTLTAHPHSFFEKDEDGDVIMRDAPGAAPEDENQNSNMPLLELWAPSNRFRR